MVIGHGCVHDGLTVVAFRLAVVMGCGRSEFAIVVAIDSRWSRLGSQLFWVLVDLGCDNLWVVV